MSLLSRFAHVQGSLKYMTAVTVALGLASAAQAQQQQPQTRPAQTQQGQPPAPAPGQPQEIKMVPNPGQAWTKICGKEENGAETCLTAREFVMDNHSRGIAMTVYDIGKPQDTKHIRILVPLGFKLKPGVRLTVGKNQPVPGYYDVCLPAGCYVNFENAVELVKQIQKGEDAILVVRDPLGADIKVTFPLEGFDEAYKGKPIDPQKIEDERKKLEEDLIKKSDEMRKQLLGQGTAPSVAETPATAP